MAINTAEAKETSTRPKNNNKLELDAPMINHPTATISENIKTVFFRPNQPANRPPSGAIGRATKYSIETNQEPRFSSRSRYAEAIVPNPELMPMVMEIKPALKAAKTSAFVI